MEVLSSFYPNMRTTNHLIPKIFGCVSFVHVHSPNKGKLDPRAVKYIFVGYSSTQKGYKCNHPPSTIHHPKFFVLVDVTFNESESYFPASYLQGKNFFKEDKDWDSYFIDPFSINPPKVISLVLVPSASLPVPKLELSPIEPTKNRMTGKVYSRKKDAVPKLIQV